MANFGARWPTAFTAAGVDSALAARPPGRLRRWIGGIAGAEPAPELRQDGRTAASPAATAPPRIVRRAPRRACASRAPGASRRRDHVGSVRRDQSVPRRNQLGSGGLPAFAFSRFLSSAPAFLGAHPPRSTATARHRRRAPGRGNAFGRAPPPQAPAGHPRSTAEPEHSQQRRAVAAGAPICEARDRRPLCRPLRIIAGTIKERSRDGTSPLTLLDEAAAGSGFGRSAGGMRHVARLPVVELRSRPPRRLLSTSWRSTPRRPRRPRTI